MSHQMSSGGTTTKSPAAFEEEAAFLAAQIRSNASDVETMASLNCLTKDLDAGLGLFIDMLRNPGFDEGRLEFRRVDTAGFRIRRILRRQVRRREALLEGLDAEPRGVEVLERAVAEHQLAGAEAARVDEQQAVAAAQATETESEMVLLWGIAVHRSPEPALRAMAHTALTMTGVFQAIIAERLGTDPLDPRAGALGAAFSGLVAYSYQRWVAEGGTGSLADMVAESFAVMSELH